MSTGPSTLPVVIGPVTFQRLFSTRNSMRVQVSPERGTLQGYLVTLVDSLLHAEHSVEVQHMLHGLMSPLEGLTSRFFMFLTALLAEVSAGIRRIVLESSTCNTPCHSQAEI